MEPIVSCCGVVCSTCEWYPSQCNGCPEIKGQVFWLTYTGESVCSIYQCCVNTKGRAHCGQCAMLPCAFYFSGDPTKTEAENDAIRLAQIQQLRSRL